jgi:hypothetical protein
MMSGEDLWVNRRPSYRVRAMSANQRPAYPGDEGGVRTCVFENCTYTGDGLTETLDRSVGFD